ncbi:MAG: DUF2283 domain-containing protein [Nanoarchaeota archaeon]
MRKLNKRKIKWIVKEGEEEDFEEIAPGINIELDKDGDIIGVEILKASRFVKVLDKEAMS